MVPQPADDFAWFSDIDEPWGCGLLFVCCSCHAFWLDLYLFGCVHNEQKMHAQSTVSAMFAHCLVEDLRSGHGMRAFNGSIPERMHR